MKVCAVSYKTVSPIQLLNGISALNRGIIPFRAFRVYLGCMELVAIREAATRRAKRLLKLGKPVKSSSNRRYQVDELVTLTGAAPAGIRRDLNSLQKVGLLTFEPSCIRIAETLLPISDELQPRLPKKRSLFRPIPIPRRFLRFLSRCKCPALLKTAIAHLLRGLSIDRATGTINPRGTVKLSWITTLMDISERAARYARGELIRLGWITRDDQSHQWKLNRDGAYFEIKLDWREKRAIHRSQEEEAVQNDQTDGASEDQVRSPLPEAETIPTSPSSPVVVVDNLIAPVSENAPPVGENCAPIAPPNKRLKTPYRPKNQKPPGSGGSLNQGNPPTLRNVTSDDLKDFFRTEALYWQAVSAKLIPHSEASALHFLGAAVRAKTARRGSPPRIFMGIIRRNLWHHITHAQEERARQALKRFRENDPTVFRVRKQTGTTSRNYSCHELLRRVGINLAKMAV